MRSNPVQQMLHKNISMMTAIDKAMKSKAPSIRLSNEVWQVGSENIPFDKQRERNCIRYIFEQIIHALRMAFCSCTYGKKFNKIVADLKVEYAKYEEIQKVNGLIARAASTAGKEKDEASLSSSEEQKPESPKKAENPAPAPVIDEKKPEAPIPPAAAPTAEEKKPEPAPAKEKELTAAEPKEEKQPEAPVPPLAAVKEKEVPPATPNVEKETEALVQPPANITHSIALAQDDKQPSPQEEKQAPTPTSIKTQDKQSQDTPLQWIKDLFQK